MAAQYAETRLASKSWSDIFSPSNMESARVGETSLRGRNARNTTQSKTKRLKNWLFDRQKKEFTNFTLIMTPVSMLLYIFDVGSDLLNAYSYYINPNNIENNMTYFELTLAFTVAPSLIMHSFSLWRAWESLREHRSQNTRKNNLHLFVFILTHILQVGLIYRFVRSIYFGRKSQKGNDDYYHKKWISEDENTVLMRSIEVYFEAIPQLMLQIYIMLTTGQVTIITVLACLGSVGVLSMVTRSIGVSMDTGDKDLFPAETICFLLYQACSSLSRVLAFALLLNLNVAVCICLLLAHWNCAADLWCVVNYDNGNYQRMLFGPVIGFIFIFNFPIGFLDDGVVLIFIAIAYFVENMIIAGCWFPLRPSVVNITDSSIGQTNSTIPPFTNSTIPPFTNSTIPSFNGTTTSEYVIPNNIAIVIMVSIPALFILSLISLVILGRLTKRH